MQIDDELLIGAAKEIQAALQEKLRDMSKDSIQLSRAQAILATGMIGALIGLISNEDEHGASE